MFIPGLPQNVILGVDFCRSFHIQLDFLKNICTPQHDPAEILTLENVPTPSPDRQQLRIVQVKETFKKLGGDRLGRTNKLSLNIDTGDAKPFRQYQYPLSPYLLEAINKLVDEMLALDVITPSKSPWCSPVLLVKKSNGDYRFCFDGRKLNEVTKHDSYPLPRIDRILSLLRDAKYISAIDLRHAFWQVPLTEQSQEKTAFAVPGRGLFHFKVMPFGLRNSAQTQQRLMDAIFGPQFEPSVFVYLDDLIVVSSDFESQSKMLEEVSRRLEAANLTINLEKCKFFQTSLKYLGYVIDADGLHTDPEKIAAMVEYPRPQNATEIKRFIGLCSWYRRFIHEFSSLVAPISDLLRGKKKKQEVLWSEAAEQSFQILKTTLASAPVLSSPDFSRRFTVQCDASDVGLGGVLTQDIDGVEKVICFASRSLSKAERNYSVTERECLAVLFCVEKFRAYVEGAVFTVITDHHSLLYLFRLRNPTGKLARWVLRLQQFSFDIVHRKGKFHCVPDALSRIPRVASDPRHQPPEISLVDLEPTENDRWYRDMIRRVTENEDEYPAWRVDNQNRLLRFCPSRVPLEANEREWKLVVPKSKRRATIQSCHDPPTAGHFGTFKTLQRVREIYFWPKMRADIFRYIRNCRICASQKIPTTAPPGLMGREKIVRYPWQIIALDFMGPFPETRHKNKYLLVVSDWFSKYTLLFPLKRATAKPVVKFLEERVFLTFGVPQSIIADNGKQFVGNTFRNFVNSYNIDKIWYNAKYHPQANFVERTNKTVGTAIRSYINTHDTWDIELPKIQCAINTACHESTGYTSVFLNFGRHVPLSGDYYGQLNDDANVDFTAADRRDYATNLAGLQDVFRHVHRNLHRAYVRRSTRYNASRRDTEFNVGDRVWRRNKVLSAAANRFSAKLSPRYVPGVVSAKISNLVYNIHDENGSDAGRWHIQDLKPYYDDADSDGELSSSASDITDSESTVSVSD